MKKYNLLFDNKLYFYLGIWQKTVRRVGGNSFGELAIWSPHHYLGILFDGVSLP